MKDHEHHPLAELFPIISAAEIKDLAADIKERGLQSAIILYEGKILDGRHRYEACGIAGVKPRFETYNGNDPVGFVFSANLRRRHLTDGQRAMIAAKLATMTHGGDRKSEGRNQVANLPLDQEKAAETLDVSPRSVRVAKTVMDASPKLTKQVEAGKLSLNAAHQQIKEKEAKGEPVFDATGLIIREAMVPLWNRGDEVRSLMSAVSKIKCALERASEDDDPLYRPVTFKDADGKGETWNNLMAGLSNVYTALKLAIPYAICPACSTRKKDCTTCWGRGFVSEHFWKVSTAKETRAIRANVVKQQEALKT